MRETPKISAAADLGPVRVNFRFASFAAVAACHSDKAGRDQYLESPHETNGLRRHEIDPYYIDLQYQPLQLIWTSDAGQTLRYTLDWAVETQDNEIVMGEDKASAAFFVDPRNKPIYDTAERALAQHGVRYERRVSGGSATDIELLAIKSIFDARRTIFEDADVERARQRIIGDGGTARLVDVLEAVGGHLELALHRVFAMMHKRHLALPLDQLAMPDTPVTLPPAATPSKLRNFLALHAVAETDA